jgi:integrase
MQDQGTARKRGREGVEERHQRGCPSPDGGGCTCRPNPSYRAYVYDRRTGRKIKRTFSGKGALAAARQWRAHTKSDLGRGTLAAPTTRTVRDAAEEWIERAEAGTVRARGRQPYKPKVVRSYKADLEAVVVPALGTLRLSEVRRSDVQRLADRLLEHGAEGGNGPLTSSRVRNILMPLRAVYRYELQRSDDLTVNPTQNLDLPSDEGRRDRVASPEEAERLFAVLPDDARAIFGTAFYGGLRCGELQALRWSDVDLATGVLRVERSWDAKAGEVAPKSRKGKRGVPINGTLRDYLDEQKARTGRDGDDLVFGQTATAPFTPTNIHRKARRVWAAENDRRAEHGDDDDRLEPIGLHECRHSYVSWMHAAGHTLEEIGDYVGHASAYMVDRYRHLLEGHERRSVARQDDYLGNGIADDGAGVVRALRDLLEAADPAELDRHAVEIRALVDGRLAQAEQIEGGGDR